MTFEEIQQRAVADWEAWQSDARPRILVGTATCGKAAGADVIVDTFVRELRERNIAATVTGVGCIGLCYVEPIVDIILPVNRELVTVT